MLAVLSERGRRILTWGLLVLLAVVLFPTNTINFPPDSVAYLQRTFGIIHDWQYAYLYRGPVMPAISAVLVTLFGGAIEMVTLVPRVMFAAALLLFGGLTWRLYGATAALFATTYLAFSPIIHKSATQFHVDIFVAAFGAASLWVLFEGLNRRSYPWMLASGVLLGLAFMTKEVLIVLFPLWTAAWILFPPHDKRLAALTITAIAAALATIAPWAAFVALNGELSMLLGKMFNIAGSRLDSYQQGLLSKTWETLTNIPGAIRHFYSLYFVPQWSASDKTCNFCMDTYGTLFLISQLVLITRAVILRNRYEWFSVFAFGTTIPLLIYLGERPLDSRQTTIIFVTGVLAVAAFGRTVVDLVSIAASQLRQQAPGGIPAHLTVVMIAPVVLTTTLAVTAITSPGVRTQFRTPKDLDDPGRQFALLSDADTWFKITGHAKLVTLKAGYWIRERLAPDETVLTAYRRTAKLLDPLLFGRTIGDAVSMHNLKPWLQAWEQGGPSSAADVVIQTARGGPFRAIQPDSTESRPRHGTLLMVWANRGRRTAHCFRRDRSDVPIHFCKLYFVEEMQRLRRIENRNVKYVIVADMMHFKTRYFDANPSFEKVKHFEASTRYADRDVHVDIYEVIDTAPLNREFVPSTSPYVGSILDLFEAQYPEAYETWERQVLNEAMGGSTEQIKAIRERRTHCFRQDQAGSFASDCPWTSLRSRL